ncbi:hypothetical protein [Jannaschia formosa]|uniref:hypothetical protein n=1 Tax=Jannaschia formosa TaxID=2259592 RepID=UPI000E1C35D5|nr:hypothetical protein [Jannaschia formosa]TFL16890.1 hypothetical protein DR046_17295 [Jannaschia formosa]
MDIVLHLGAHRTDEDRMLRALRSEADRLAAAGICVPAPAQARPAMRRALQSGSRSLLAAEGGVVASFGVPPGAGRLVLSFEGFLANYVSILAGSTIYADAGEKAAALRDVFEGHDVRFLMAIRNPATFVPAVFAASTSDDFTEFLAGQTLEGLRWLPVVERIRAACPEVPLTLWCNEDLPLIWPEVLRAATGLQAPHAGDTTILREIMTEPGFRRLVSYLRDNPPPNLATWRKVVTAFLGKYADESQVEEEIALPGWTQEVIVRLTALYERDIAALKARGDLQMLAP